MNTAIIDRQINNYLEHLTAKQKKAVLTVVKTFAEEQEEYDHWKDKEFFAEMERRSKEMESGAVKGYTWEEVKQKARLAIKTKKR